MAYWWFLAIETDSEQQADRIINDYDTSPIQVGEKLIGVGLEKKFIDNTWWCVKAVPYYGADTTGLNGLSVTGGATSEEHAKLMTSVGQVLYERLRPLDDYQILPYQIALIGSEASFYGFGNHDELVNDLPEDDYVPDGLVISTELWARAGKPEAFQKRSENAYWIPWHGEKYIR